MSFDLLAPVYESLERLVFGSALQRARTAFVPQLDACRSALLIGEGDGRFLGALLAANSRTRVTSVEQSTAMIQRARRRISGANRVELINAKIEDAVLEQRYDAIVTNFLLDCFTEAELEPIVKKLADHAEPHAVWLIAEFTAVRRGKLLVSVMYAFFRLTTRISAKRLPNYNDLLQRHGFRCQERRLFFGGVVCSELWQRA